jgi:putative Holliday junction resolvase
MNQHCLGIDWGTKRIGIALGNTETKLASPLGSVDSLGKLLEMIKSERIEHLVVGLPLHSDGQEKALHSQFKTFLETLKAQSGLSVTTIDERFTSQAADKLMGKTARDGKRDAVAAMIILQSYFDSL